VVGPWLLWRRPPCGVIEVRRPSEATIFDSARTWDAASLGALLAASSNLVNAVDSKGRTPLHRACAVKPGAPGLGESNGIETVTALLNAGAEFQLAAPVARAW
jgi:ankyrin repeat protein